MQANNPTSRGKGCSSARRKNITPNKFPKTLSTMTVIIKSRSPIIFYDVIENWRHCLVWWAVIWDFTGGSIAPQEETGRDVQIDRYSDRDFCLPAALDKGQSPVLLWTLRFLSTSRLLGEILLEVLRIFWSHPPPLSILIVFILRLLEAS